MRASIPLMHFLEGWEGCSLTEYNDIAGKPTIGIGHLILPDERFPPEGISQEEAYHILALDLSPREDKLNKLLLSPTSQQQFDGFLSLMFNIGENHFASSTALKRHNAGFIPQAADAMRLWNKATIDGKLVEAPGLCKRRDADRDIYLSGDYSGRP